MRLEEYLHIGKKMRRIRKEAGMTQQDIATVLSLKQSTYATYEQERNFPSVELMQAFCDYFNASFEKLISTDTAGALMEVRTRERRRKADTAAKRTGKRTKEQ